MTIAFRVYPQLKTAHNAEYADEQAALTTLEASRNCACAGGAGLANWYRGKQSGDLGFVTHHAFRMAAGNPRRADGTPAGLTTSQVLAALLSFGVPAKRYYGASYTVVTAALALGAAVGICVHYPVITAFENGKWSGQPSFTGDHWIDLYGWTPNDPAVDGRNSTTDFDSLFDGRISSGRVMPDGPQVAPFAVFRQAMAAFPASAPLGTDKGAFVVVPPPPVTQADFMRQIARVESGGDYTLQMPNGAYGKYQIMPSRWKTWAPKALGTDPTLARASATLPPPQWVPEPTPENQETVATWKMARLFAKQGDWRRVAASWRGGDSIGLHQPADQHSDGTYYWSAGTLKYVNNVCYGYTRRDGTFRVTLGFPETTRETVLPALPGVTP